MTTTSATTTAASTMRREDAKRAALCVRTAESSAPEIIERRAPSPLGKVGECSDPKRSPCAGEDDKGALVLTTAELEPLDQPSSEDIDAALEAAGAFDDWLQQHEVIIVLRRLVVHHTGLISASAVDRILRLLVDGSDNLRSALAKNALVALAESFEYLGYGRLRRLISSDPSVVDVLLRRGCCEKRFLRDAALEAIDKAIEHLASPELIACASRYATNKNGKIVAIASRIMAQSFTRLTATQHFNVERFLEREEELCSIFEALARFRSGKDSAARVESLACFRLLGESLGRERFQAALKSGLADQHAAVCILTEVFPPAPSATGGNHGRRGSLRDRVLAQQQSGSASDVLA